MTRSTMLSDVRQTLLAWWLGINACEATGAHQLDRPRLGIWSVIALHHSSWPDSALRR